MLELMGGHGEANGSGKNVTEDALRGKSVKTAVIDRKKPRHPAFKKKKRQCGYLAMFRKECGMFNRNPCLMQVTRYVITQSELQDKWKYFSLGTSPTLLV